MREIGDVIVLVGMALFVNGLLSNLVAVSVNGFRMPVRGVTDPLFRWRHLRHQHLTDATRLKVLCEWIPLPWVGWRVSPGELMFATGLVLWLLGLAFTQSWMALIFLVLWFPCHVLFHRWLWRRERREQEGVNRLIADLLELADGDQEKVAEWLQTFEGGRGASWLPLLPNSCRGGPMVN